MNLAILDVAIGLVLIYLLLSMVCSAVLEAFSHYFNRRGYALERHLVRVMGRATLDEFCRLPGFAALKTRGDPIMQDRMDRRFSGLRGRLPEWLRRSHFPAYIPTETFVSLALDWQSLRNQGREWCDDHEFGRVVSLVSQDMAGHRDLQERRIGDWFDTSMARMAGPYKARTNLYMAVIALLVVLAANANSFRLGNELYRNPAIQQALVLQAQAVVELGQPASVTEDVLREELSVLPLLGWSETGPSFREAIIDWDALGFLLTVFALMMGADFWFNALQKLMRIRTSIKPAETADKPAGAGTAAGTSGVGSVPETTGSVVAVRAARDQRAVAPAERERSVQWPTTPVPMLLAATLARLAYAPQSADLPAELADAGYRRTLWLSGPKSGTEGTILENDHYRLLAFRGTEPKQVRDIKTDLDKQLIPMPDGFRAQDDTSRVHQGFARALEEVWSDLIAHLDDSEALPLVITGHSLGGALATIAAHALQERMASPERKPIETVSVVTFGQPRVGDGEFARQYDRRFGPLHWRVVNNRDIVPRLPPREMGFRHVGRLLYFDADGRASLDPSQWLRLLDRFKFDTQADWAVQMREYISDHDMDGYIERVRG
jgi:triacylglycerol lipase